jgi:hypothetical protein
MWKKWRKAPRSWAQARLDPSIQSITDTRIKGDDSEDMPWLVCLADGWTLCGDLTAFYVSSFSDLKSQWNDIAYCPEQPTAPATAGEQQ